MKKCLESCKKYDMACPINNCKFWISYEEEYNCSLESIARNGSMTLRSVGERLKLSFVRIKQIEDAALKKISHFLEEDSI